MGQVIALSLTASLNPTLLAMTTLMLLTRSPKKLMLGYLCGALMTSLTLGLIIVFELSGSSAAKTTQNGLSPAVDIGLGALALAIAFVVHTGRDEPLRERRRARKAAKTERDLRAGSGSSARDRPALRSSSARYSRCRGRRTWRG